MFDYLIFASVEEITRKISSVLESCIDNNRYKSLVAELFKAGIDIESYYTVEGFEHFEGTAHLKGGEVKGLLVPFSAAVSFDSSCDSSDVFVTFGVMAFTIDGITKDADELYESYKNGSFDLGKIYSE